MPAPIITPTDPTSTNPGAPPLTIPSNLPPTNAPAANAPAPNAPGNSSSVTIDPYDAKTGAGTLSYYASKYGTSVANLLALNKNNNSVINANTIKAGGQLFIPKSSAPAIAPATSGVTSSTSVRNAITASQPPTPTTPPVTPGSQPSGQGGGAAPAGMEYGANGQLQPIGTPTSTSQLQGYLAQWTSGNPPPTPPNLTQMVLGQNIPELQTNLSQISAALMNAKGYLSAYGRAMSGQGMTASMVDAANTAEGKKMQGIIDTLTEQETNASNMLSNATSYVKTLMDASNMDYNNASQQYQAQYTAAKAVQDQISADASEVQKSSAAFLTAVQNMASTNGLDWSKLPPAMQAQIGNAEVQAGYPPGFTQYIISQSASGALGKVLSTSSRSAGGEDYYDVLSRMPDGSMKVTTIARGPSSTSPSTQKDDIASMAQKLQSWAGTDHYVSPDDYMTAKDAWVSTGYPSKDFDANFANFRNPSDTYDLDTNK